MTIPPLLPASDQFSSVTFVFIGGRGVHHLAPKGARKLLGPCVAAKYVDEALEREPAELAAAAVASAATLAGPVGQGTSPTMWRKRCEVAEV